jgi:hypothetical protein
MYFHFLFPVSLLACKQTRHRGVAVLQPIPRFPSLVATNQSEHTVCFRRRPLRHLPNQPSVHSVPRSAPVASRMLRGDLEVSRVLTAMSLLWSVEDRALLWLCSQ